MLRFAAISDAFGFRSPNQFRNELLVLLAVCTAGAAWGVFQFSQFDFVRMCRGFDLWFDSDPARTVANLSSRWGTFHERSTLHPLYSILIAAPFGALGDVLNLPNSTLSAIYVGTQAASLCGMAYVAMRAFAIGRLDAILGLLLLNSTSAVVYWIGFTEWTVFGSVAILVSVAWIAAPATLRNRVTGLAQNLVSASIVVTNWPIGVAASLMSDFPKLRWRQAFQHTRDALAVMAALTVVQYMLFPKAGGFLNIWSEVGAGAAKMGGSIFSPILQFFGQTLVAPVPGVFDWASAAPSWGVNIMASGAQGIPVTPLTIVILALWVGLWALGIFAAVRGGVSRAVLWFVLGVIGYLFVFHTVFGYDMFLFSVAFAPPLTFVAVWSLRSPYKIVARVMCVALIAASFAHNYPSFQSAVKTHNAIGSGWLMRAGHPAPQEAAETDCR
ncbi:MAG: hypothetical protein ABL956_05285 [Hyphomonadaceae bacterium]